MSVDLDFTIASAINPWVANDSGLIESNAGTLRIASGRLELINVSTTNTLTVASSTPNQSIDVTLARSVAPDLWSVNYRLVPFLLYSDANNYIYFYLFNAATNNVQPRLMQRLAGVETTLGTFMSPGYASAELPTGVRFGLSVTWAGADATFTLTKDGVQVESPITIVDCALTTGVPGCIFNKGTSVNDWVALQTLEINNGTSSLTIDSSPANIRSEQTGLTITVSGVTESNITNISQVDLRLVNASGVQLTPTAYSYTSATVVQITFSVPASLAIQYNSTGYPIYCNLNGEIVSTGNIPYLPVVTKDFINLSGTVVESRLWVSDGDFADGVEVYGPNDNNVYTSNGIVNSTTPPNSDAVNFTYTRPFQSAADGWSDVEPVVGAQNVFDLLTSGGKTFSVAANGTFTFGDITVPETVDSFFIESNGTVGNVATITLYPDGYVENLVSFVSLGAAQNSDSHPTNAGALRSNETDVVIILMDGDTVVSYSTNNTTDENGILNNINVAAIPEGTVLKCIVIFSDDDGIPAFDVTVIEP